MPEEMTPSSTTSETPHVDTPVTGTPTTQASVTPAQKSSLTLEEAMQRLSDLEKKQSNATEELERHRKNAKKLADYEKAEQDRQQAALSDVEKANKARQDAETRTQHLQAKLVTAHVKLAAQAKGIIDPDLAALAVQQDLELDDDGMPKDLDKALDKLIKNKPYLVPAKSEPAPETPAQTATQPAVQTPAIPAMNPGRNTIASPAQQANPQGKFIPITLQDVFRRP